MVLLCTIVSIMLDAVPHARAQDEGNVSLSAQVGFDGFCKENDWLPIHLKIQNTGSDLKGSVEVTYEKNSGGSSTTRMDVDLPGTSRKEFFLYTYFDGDYSKKLTVSLRDGKRILKETNQSVRCLDAESTIFGVIADNPSPYDALNDVKPLSSYVRVAQLSLSDLPDRVQAWNTLDALVVTNTDTGSLTSQQKQALQSWIASGGKLFIVGGINWQGTASGLKEFMPLDITATRHVGSLSELQLYARAQSTLDSDAVLATGTVHKGTQVLVRQEDIPLLIQKPLGFGTVYFFAADPALQPLNDWIGMPSVYEHLLSSQSHLVPWDDGIQGIYQANQALATIPELRMPPAFYVWCILGFYIALLGPINYFALKRLKRRELAWVTIPAIVILFTSLAYGTGFFYRGVTPTLNRIAVVQAWEGLDQAQVHGLVGIYSPARTKYDLIAKDQFMFQPFGSADVQTAGRWTALQQDASMVVSDVRAEIGSMNTVALQGSIQKLKISHNLVITLRETSPLLTGDITNNSSYTIRDAMIVTPGGWRRFGDLAPGKTKSVNLSLSPSTAGANFYGADPMTILQLGYDDIRKDEDAARRNAFLGMLLSSDNGGNQGNWGVYLMGWVDKMKLPAELQGRRSRSIDTLLYVESLSPSIKTESDALRIPTSLFAWESSIRGKSPYYADDVSGSGYVLRFQPAVPVSFKKVQSLDFYLVSSASFQDLIVSAWDYDLKTWVHIPVVTTTTRLRDADRYVGPDGEVRIQIRSNSSGWTQITASFITMVVQP